MAMQFLGTLSTREERPSLEQAQIIIGGWVEMIHVGDVQVLVDEEGLIKQLPINEEASDMFGRPLYGPVLVLENEARWD
jgi:hypothetical protein